MTTRSPQHEQSLPAAIWHALFGGPLLRLPPARTREARRLRLALTASVAFHSVLLAGGALVAAGAVLQGGGDVAGIEIVLDTRGLDSGPMAGRSYAPPQELAERAPTDDAPPPDAAPEAVPDELEEPPPELTEAPQPLPDDPQPVPPIETPAAAPPQQLAALDLPERSDGLPEQIERPRGIEPFETPPAAVDDVPVVAESPPPAQAAPTPLQPLPPIDAPAAPTAAVDAQADAVPAPALPAFVEPVAAVPAQQTTPAPPVPALVAPPAPAAPEPAALEPVALPGTQLASLEPPQPFVRSLAPAPAVPEASPVPAAPTPDEAATETQPEAPLAIALPPEPATPEPPALDEPPPPEQFVPPPGPVEWVQPIAPPRYDPRIEDALAAVQTGRPEGPESAIAAILAEISCGHLDADVTVDGSVAVRGFMTSSDEQAEVRQRLSEINGIAGVADDNVVVVGDGLCSGLGVYAGAGAEIAPDAEPMDHLPPELRPDPLFGMIQGGRAAFAEAQYLEVYVETPDYPAHVYIDFFKPNGEVVHLLPSELNPTPANYYPAAATTIPISAAEPGSIAVPAGPPYGTGMVVTLSTSAPLFDLSPPRPRVELAEGYLAALEEELQRRALTPDFRSQYGYVFVETQQQP
ncbi:MAG: hypothetical protein R3F55_17090 [Alphaproteobacteria bacterium]